MKLLISIGLIIYAFLFLNELSPYWFSPLWTTDDARQQLFIFHESLNPGRFEGDIIFESMKAYFGPLAFWVGHGITLLTQDPIMTGHWVMAIQLSLTTFFLFLLVRARANYTIACFAVLWLLHTRPLVHSMVGGLPRGWAGVVITSCLWALLTERIRAIWIFFLLGTLLHPPSAFVMVLAYGGLIFYRQLKGGNIFKPNKLTGSFLILAPLLLLVTVFSVKRPESIGKMHTLNEASLMPEFSRDGGRFPFVPLLPIYTEATSVGAYAFMNNSYLAKSKAEKIEVRELGGVVLFSVCSVFLVLWFWSRKKGFEILPDTLWFYFLAVVFSYLLARLLAFNLYVPDRYLLWPLNIFWIVSVCIHIARVSKEFSRHCLPIMLVTFSLFLYWLGGDGLKGRGSFNTDISKHEKLLSWLKESTPAGAVIAGHPIVLNPILLGAARKIYISEETFHPFYDKYYQVSKNRLIKSLNAHYAESENDFLDSLKGEEIDYFVFGRAYLEKESKKKRRRLFRPFNEIVKGLEQRNEYFLGKVLKEHPQYLAYLDDEFAIIGLSGLKATNLAFAQIKGTYQ